MLGDFSGLRAGFILVFAPSDLGWPEPPPAEEARWGEGLIDSLSSSLLGREIGRGILDLLDRLVRLDSEDVARLPSEPGVETWPIQEDDDEPLRVQEQFAQCSRFL